MSRILNFFSNKTGVEKRYDFGRTIGKGVSSRVIEGTDKKNSSIKVAIKIISPDHKKLYKEEVEVYQRLIGKKKISFHKNVVNFLMNDEYEKEYYIVTQLCEGGPLFDVVTSSKKGVFESDARRFISQVLNGLKYCHDRDVVHRDLKPENIMLESKDISSNICIVDFGSATVVDSKDTKRQYYRLAGSAYYLSPEVAYYALSRSKNKKTASMYDKPTPLTGDILKMADVWAVGVIAFILMTGQAPFHDRRGKEYIFKQIVKGEFQIPQKDVRFNKELRLTHSFKDFVSKILTKDINKRLDLKGAMEHPWICPNNKIKRKTTDSKDNTNRKSVSNKEDTKNEYKIPQTVIDCIRQFDYQCKLKEAVTATLAKNMQKEPEIQIKAHFRRLDNDGDGFLNEDELYLLLHDIGLTRSEARSEAKKIILSNDINNDGKIDFLEFKALNYRKILTENNRYIHQVFDTFDQNGDGFIDLNELKAVLLSEEPNQDNNNNNNNSNNKDDDDTEKPYYGLQTLMKMIKQVDQNGDNKISFEEFQDAMKEDVEGGLDFGRLDSGLGLEEEE